MSDTSSTTEKLDKDMTVLKSFIETLDISNGGQEFLRTFILALGMPNLTLIRIFSGILPSTLLSDIILDINLSITELCLTIVTKPDDFEAKLKEFKSKLEKLV